MAIDLNNMTSGANRPLSSQSSVKPLTSTSAPQGPAPASGEAVHLTEQAQQMSRAESQLANATGVDPNKVNNIKQAIAEGRYHVDPEKLAQNITKFESELSSLLDE